MDYLNIVIFFWIGIIVFAIGAVLYNDISERIKIHHMNEICQEKGFDHVSHSKEKGYYCNNISWLEKEAMKKKSD